MKRLRIFAALLCILLVFQSVGYAADNGADKLQDYSGAIEELSRIGLTNDLGFTLSDNKPITRAEFITLVMNVDYGNSNHEALSERVFDDVETNSAYAWAVSAAVKRGIISGNGDGLFEPDSPITYESAVKILVGILGYNLRAEALGGFPAGYFRQAVSIGIEVDGILNSQSLTGGEAAYMLLQAVNAEIMAPSGFGSSVTYEVKRDETWLKNSRNTVRYEGVMQANEFSSLYGGAGLGSGKVEIDGVKYNTECDINGYLGYNLYYYVEDDDTVIYAYPEGNDITVIESDDVYDTDGRNIVYYENGRKKSISLPKGVAVIYNDVAYPDYEMKSFIIKSGYIEIVKINGSTETVKIFDERPVYVAAIDTVGEVIYDAIGHGSINYDDYKNFEIYDENGDVSDIKKIAVGDVLNMYISAKGDYATAYKSTGKSEGMITAISEDDGIASLGVDGVEYKVSAAGSIDVSALAVGDRIKIYLDKNGRAVYAEHGSRDAAKYAYLASISATGGMDPKFSFKLYTSDGELKKFDAIKKFKINGNEVSNVSDIPNGLENGSAMLYETDVDGYLTKIYTPDADGSPLVTIAGVNSRKFYPRETCYVFAPENSKVLSDSFCLDKSTLMMTIPSDPSSASEKKFSIIDPTAISLFEERTVSAYTKNTENNIAEFVIETAAVAGSINTQNEAFIITAVTRAVNEDGDEVCNVTVSGKSVKNRVYKTTDKDICKGYEPGDIVLLNLNLQNEITDMKLIVDFNRTDGSGNTEHNVILTGTGITANGRWYSNIAIFEGYPYSVKNKIVRFAEKGTDPTTIGAVGDTFYFDAKNVAVFEIDTNAQKKDKLVTERAIGSFAGYKENGLTENCIFYVRQGIPMMMVIYK